MPKATRSGIPYVSTKNFTEHDAIDFENAKRIAKEDYLRLCRKIKPEKGDLLLSRYGTVGEVRLVKTDQPFQASYSIAILKSLKNVNLSTYLLLVLRSPVVQDQIQRDIRASAQPDLGLDHIRRFIIPLPPLSEVYEMVRRVESMFKLADTVEKRVAAATGRAEKLTQAILTKAFRGELVPTEAELARRERRSYESASELLARIKSARDSKRSPESVNRIRGPRKRMK
jgi:type I restriction enzyme S subunit